jgi:hypothetical protein
MTAMAQKAITSVHFYNVKNVETEKAYIASLKEVNKIIAEIGLPKNYYTWMKVDDSDTTSSYRSCTIGHWASENDYKTIHEHPKFKAWATKYKDLNGVYMKDQLYRRFYNID